MLRFRNVGFSKIRTKKCISPLWHRGETHFGNSIFQKAIFVGVCKSAKIGVCRLSVQGRTGKAPNPSLSGQFSDRRACRFERSKTLCCQKDDDLRINHQRHWGASPCVPLPARDTARHSPAVHEVVGAATCRARSRGLRSPAGRSRARSPAPTLSTCCRRGCCSRASRGPSAGSSSRRAPRA